MMKYIAFLMIVLFLVSCAGDNDRENRESAGAAEEKMADDTIMVEQPDTMTVALPADTVEEPAEQPQPKLRAADPQDYARERQTPEFHFKRGLVLYEINKYEEGIKEFDTVIEMNPSMTKAYINRGKGKMELKRYGAALKDFEKALNIDNSDTTAYLHLGLTHYFMGNYRGSVDAYSELIKQSPKNSTAYFNRGIAYGQLQEYENAIRDFKRATELNPDYTEAYFNLGLAYYWSGDQEKACENWTIASNKGSQKAAGAVSKYCY